MAPLLSPPELRLVGGPAVRLLDSRERGGDERALRAWARAEGEASGAPHISRSYRNPFALVAWHATPLGVDLERIEPCDAAFADLICTPTERGDAERQANRDAYLTSLWSSKEALSKALGDALRYEPARLDSPMRWPDGASGPWRATPVAAPEGHVAWICWREGAAS